MALLAELVEENPNLAVSAFTNIEEALNQVLPGSDVHARYRDAEEIGLAMLVGTTTQISYNPLAHPGPEPSFKIDNQDRRSGAWEPLPQNSEFLDGRVTNLGRFVFFAFAKTENMRITGMASSYDPHRLAITPGRVGLAGGRRLFGSFVSLSGLWEVHDHLVSGTYATEVARVAAEVQEPTTTDDFAEYFERAFAEINELLEGVAAADLGHGDVGKLLSLIDHLPYPR